MTNCLCVPRPLKSSMPLGSFSLDSRGMQIQVSLFMLVLWCCKRNINAAVSPPLAINPSLFWEPEWFGGLLVVVTRYYGGIFDPWLQPKNRERAGCRDPCDAKNDYIATGEYGKEVADQNCF